MKTLLAFVALAVCQLAASQTTIEIKSFTILAVSGNIELALIKSSENKMIIEDDSNVLKVVSEEGTLALSNDSGKDVEGVLYYTESIEKIAIAGGAEIYFKDNLKTNNLAVSIAGGSEISLNVDSQNLSVDAASGSEVEISGTALNFKTNVASGAEVAADKLITKNSNCVVASGGEASVHATGIVNATVASGGELTIYGNPEKVNEIKADNGKINVIK